MRPRLTAAQVTRWHEQLETVGDVLGEHPIMTSREDKEAAYLTLQGVLEEMVDWIWCNSPEPRRET